MQKEVKGKFFSPFVNSDASIPVQMARNGGLERQNIQRPLDHGNMEFAFVSEVC